MSRRLAVTTCLALALVAVAVVAAAAHGGLPGAGVRDLLVLLTIAALAVVGGLMAMTERSSD